MFPATSIWRGTWGTGAPHGGSRAYVISNHVYGYLQSDLIPVSPGGEYDLYAYVRGELDPDDSHRSWIIRAYFYNSSGGSLGSQDAAAGGAGTPDTTWQQQGGRVTAPANAVTMRITLWNYMNSGWVAFDDVSLVRVGTSTNLAPEPGFENAAGWSEARYTQFPATSIWRGTWGTGTPHGGSRAYVLSNHVYGYLQSDLIPVSPGGEYDLYAYVRGELDPEDSHHGGWIVRALFYDSNGAYLSYQNAASGAAGTLDTTWQNRGGRVTAPATAATLRIDLYNYMNSGWVAYDDVTLPVQVRAASYYYFNGQRVATRRGKDGALTFLHGDHLGSTALATDASGGAVARQWYYPYGEQRHATAELPTDYRFTGQRIESTIGGLYDYGARFYDPLLGRFVSADTVVPEPGNPQALNCYAYVLNNPLKYTDPTGHRYDPYGDDFGPQGPLPPTPSYLPLAQKGMRPPGGPEDVWPEARATLQKLNAANEALDPLIGWGAGQSIRWNGEQRIYAEQYQIYYNKFVFEYQVGEAPRDAWDAAIASGCAGVAAAGAAAVGRLASGGTPQIKQGSAGGPTAGKPFSRSVKSQARAENPTETCVYCRRPGTATQVDHAIPRSRGGNATIDNAQLTCPHCNNSKGAGDFPVTPPPGYTGPWPPSWW